jgi:hypothetical protein
MKNGVSLIVIVGFVIHSCGTKGGSQVEHEIAELNAREYTINVIHPESGAEVARRKFRPFPDLMPRASGILNGCPLPFLAHSRPAYRNPFLNAGRRERRTPGNGKDIRAGKEAGEKEGS